MRVFSRALREIKVYQLRSINRVQVRGTRLGSLVWGTGRSWHLHNYKEVRGKRMWNRRRRNRFDKQISAVMAWDRDASETHVTPARFLFWASVQNVACEMVHNTYARVEW